MKNLFLLAMLAIATLTSCEKEVDDIQIINTNSAAGKADGKDVYITVDRNNISVQLILRTGKNLADAYKGEDITRHNIVSRFDGLSSWYVSGQVVVTNVALNFCTLEFRNFKFVNYEGEEFLCNMTATVAVYHQ